MTDIKRQSPAKQVMLTGLLTVSLAGFSASVFAQGGGGNPTAECAEYGAVPLAKSDPPPTDDPPVDLTGTLNSGTWSSTVPVAVMIVKGATGRDAITYYPYATSGSYSNAGLPLNNGGQLPDISHITFCVDDAGVNTTGVCVLDFDKPANYGPSYPLYFNEDGWFNHEDLGLGDTGIVTRFLSCYENKSLAWCRGQLDEYLNPPDATVTSAHWYNVDTCDDLRNAGVLPPSDQVKLLATGVNLTATKNDSNGVDLTLTTDSETDTAKLLILRGIELENGGTEIEIACDGKEFNSGSSPYTCTDTPAADSYRAAEKEYDGSFIVYDEVKPKK